VSWSELPEDLLEMILIRQPIDAFNLYHYRELCCSWRSVVDKVLASSPPLLLGCEKNNNNNNIECIRLSNIFTGDWSVCRIPEFKTRDGQPLLPRSVRPCPWRGWLAMDCTTSRCSALMDHTIHTHHIFLYNPFSRAQIRLPAFKLESCFPFRFVLSSTNHNNHPSSNIIALAIWEKRAFVFVRARILFWKPGDDEEWKTFDNWDSVADIISYKGGFLAIDFDGNVTQVDQLISTTTKVPTRINIDNRYWIQFYFTRSINIYLVESVCGDVLMVHRRLGPYDLKVYKLDWERMEWDEMTSLGDEAIFLAPNHSVCIRPPAESTRNCIYFTDDAIELDMLNVSSGERHFGVYHMATKTSHSFTHFSLSHNALRHRWLY
jgi:hypothetical protein